MPISSKPISPGQALLLLMKHYKDEPLILARLKKLYLSGPQSKTEHDEMLTFLKEPILASYKIDYSPEAINEDPTRRYFETHLAYETLAHGLSDIDIKELEKHVTNLIKMLKGSTVIRDKPEEFSRIIQVLNGQSTEINNGMFIEYSSYIHKINSAQLFSHFSQEQRDKICLLVSSAFLGVMNAQYNPHLPINIYGKGIYSEQDRGKILSQEQLSTRSQHMGLMKGHMPLPRDDMARQETIPPFVRPADQAAFIKGAGWVNLNFSKMVHPFSNSISGTMLCQLRSLAQFKQDGVELFNTKDKLEKFTQLLVSSRLYGSGGHTLYEFCFPLQLESIQDEFKSIPNFNQINLDSMFHQHNESAFNTALEKTQLYYQAILKREDMQSQIREKSNLEPSSSVLKKLSATHVLSKLSEMSASFFDEQLNKLEQSFKTRFFKPIALELTIHQELKKALQAIHHEDIPSAISICSNLKQTLDKSSPKLQKSEAYQMLTLFDGALKDLKKVIHTNLTEPQINPSLKK